MRRRRPLPSARWRSHTLCPAADAPRAAPDARSDQLDSYKAARAAQSKCAQKVDVGGFDKDDPFNVEEAVKGLAVKRVRKPIDQKAGQMSANKINFVSWDPSSSILVHGDQFGYVAVTNFRDYATPLMSAQVKHDFNKSAEFLSADKIAVGSMKNTITIYKVGDEMASVGMLPSSAPAHDGYVGCLKSLNGGANLLSCGGDGDIKLWDVNKLKQTRTFIGHGDTHGAGDADSLSFAGNDENVFATSSSDETVRLWDMRVATSTACVGIYEAKAEVNSVALHPSGLAFAFGDQNGRVAMVDVRTMEKINEGKRKVQINGKQENDKVTKVCFSKSGRVCFSGYESGIVGCWDLLTPGGYKRKIEPCADTGLSKDDLAMGRGQISGLEVSPDGTSVAVASFDGFIKIYA